MLKKLETLLERLGNNAITGVDISKDKKFNIYGGSYGYLGIFSSGIQS